MRRYCVPRLRVWCQDAEKPNPSLLLKKSAVAHMHANARVFVRHPY